MKRDCRQPWQRELSADNSRHSLDFSVSERILGMDKGYFQMKQSWQEAHSTLTSTGELGLIWRSH
jgi:hypothetical protein